MNCVCRYMMALVGKNKDFFMVEIDFHHESFIVKAMSENFKQRLIKQTLESLWAISITYSPPPPPPIKKVRNIFKET